MLALAGQDSRASDCGIQPISLKMETEDHLEILHAIDSILLRPIGIQPRRPATVKHYRKKWYRANAQKLKEKRILKA